MTIQEISTEVQRASSRIEKGILKTPVIKSHVLSELTKAEIYLKLESEQYTGSFKARGSLNKLLTSGISHKEFITASTGNHGLGFARAIQITGQKGTVFLPHSASKSKVRKISFYPVTVKYHGNEPLDTELFARQFAEQSDAIWVSPYNDYDVIAGQGTIAVELLDQVDQIDDILITMGGGGLISGIGAYLKVYSPGTHIIGCEPENSPEMSLSLKAGKIVDDPEAKETLSDGSAGGIEPGAVTFPICREVVDRTVLVTEDEIKSAIKFMVYEHGKIIEGAAAVTIASLLKEKEKYKGRKVVLIICGGNIDVEKLKALL